MKLNQRKVWAVVACLFCAISLRSQQSGVVPRVIKFSGGINPQITQITPAKDNESGKNSLPTTVGVTFSLYELQEGGSPLWSEAQKVQVDEQGHYTVLLGANQAAGLPLDLFTSGKALWLGVQPELPGAVEQPRVLLVAVPYALKAADADTLGGLPASAFLSAAASQLGGGSSQSGSASFVNGQRTTDNGSPTSGPQPGATCSSVTSDGTATANSITMFTAACNLEASAITQTSGNIGISGASPAGTKFQITDTPAADFGVHYTNHELLNSSVTKNGTNKGLTFVMDLSNTTIPAGVTDSGYRVGVEGAGYANTTGFAGTLGAQYGVWGRAGLAGATSGATVSNAYAGYFDIFNAVAGTTITNAYGVFIQNSATTGTIANRYDLYASSANGKSYFAGNVGIGTTTPTAKLEVNGTAKFDSGVTVTGLAAGNCVQAGTGGLLTTAASPCGSGGGGGTITGVAAGTDLTGGGTIGMVTLKLDTTRVPELGTPNTFAGTQTVGSGDVSVSQGNLDLANTTSATTGVINLGGTAFIHDCCPNSTENAFVGINAGNFTANAASSNGGLGQNTAIGYQALEALTTGYLNAANGDQALSASTTGSYNVATGASALQANTTGNENTASGAAALAANSTGSGNTALGYSAGVNGAQTLPKTGSNSTFVGANATATVDNLTNATAIGYNAQVGESNALVLGNGAMVGIGTSTPQYALDVQGTGNFTGCRDGGGADRRQLCSGWGRRLANDHGFGMRQRRHDHRSDGRNRSDRWWDKQHADAERGYHQGAPTGDGKHLCRYADDQQRKPGAAGHQRRRHGGRADD